MKTQYLIGDKYYYINEWMMVNFRKWKGTARDVELLAVHNYFAERRAAEDAAVEIRNLLRQYKEPIKAEVCGHPFFGEG